MSTGSLNGKVAVITGATSGIGLVTARELATRGARVVIVGRNPQKTAQVAQEVNAASFVLADLSELSQVRRAAAELRASHQRVDVLVNNAGVSLQTRQESREGIELTWATNHLAPFLLTLELLPLLRASAAPKVVNVASAAHAQGRIRFDDPELKRGYDASGWGGFMAYAQSKLANILFTRELARRERWLQANAVHPGFVQTKIMTGGSGVVGVIQERLYPLLAVTPEEGAQPLIRLIDPGVSVTGRYLNGLNEGSPAPQALDDGAALRLWQLSEQYLN